MTERRYFSAAPRVETTDTDGKCVKVFPSSGAWAGGFDGPFVWMEIIGGPTRPTTERAFAHLTVEQARVIRDALATFIDAESAAIGARSTRDAI